MSEISFIPVLSLISACDREEKVSKTKASKTKAYNSKHEDPIYIGGGIMISEGKEGPLHNHIRGYTGLDWTTPIRGKSIMYDFDVVSNVEKMYRWDGKKWALAVDTPQRNKCNSEAKKQINIVLKERFKRSFSLLFETGIGAHFSCKRKLEGLVEKIKDAPLCK